jgi:hypothetical protein
MKKSTLFISGVISAFMLAVLAGGVVAYRSLAGNSQVNTQQNVPIVQQVSSPTTAAISPEDAAKVAARYLGRGDLYSVESSSLNGASAYMITFSSGDVVYVSPEGQVVGYVPAPAISSIGSSSPSVQQPAQSLPSFGGESEHESGDDD